jgi:predicted nucleic acid-binding protein
LSPSRHAGDGHLKSRQHVLRLPNSVFVRSGDALHLTCAAEQGFREVYTNDRHMLQAAKQFKLVGIDVVGA